MNPPVSFNHASVQAGGWNRLPQILTVFLSLLLVSASLCAADHTPNPPRLILQITVDQLRGDLVNRYLDRMSEGGFRYLLDRGTVYTDAHHDHANTETIVGHATLATGAHPAVHGMIGNIWLDRKSGRTTYTIEDNRYRLLTPGADINQDVEIDPTQRTARSEGRSPSAILVSTFSDELAITTNGQAKVFGVSVKDRGAVSMAGHAGKAFWFSKARGEFVTSTYYYSTYPEWVNQWNARRLAAQYADTSWTLLNDPSSYLFGNDDDQPWETDVAGFGRTFPHAYGAGDGTYYTTLLTLSPAGDALTAEFAKTLLTEENLGQDETPDYLSVSFSSNDYVGHVFGPSSLESEDNLLRLDLVLADLLKSVDKSVGLEHVLIVLSADHGGPEVPGHLQAMGIDAGYVDPDSWDRTDAIARLKQRFGLDQALIQTYAHPYVYLNETVLQQSNLDTAEVETALVEELQKFPGVSMAVSSSAMRTGQISDTAMHRQVLNNFNPQRSGNIYIVFEPHWFINDFDGLIVAATHGSPWTYDTFVPLVFAGPGIPSQRISRRVLTVDVAATLANLLGTKMPSGASGQVLTEVVTP